MSMRILLVIDHFGRGGAQRQITNLGLALNRLGHEVEYFVYYPHDALRPAIDEAGIKVWQSEKSGRYSVRVVTDLARRLRRGAYDVALSYLDTPNVYLELASLQQPQTPIVVSERSQFPTGRLSAAVRLREQLHRLADHIVVNSNAHYERLVREFPWMAERLSVILNGVDPVFFHVPPARPGPTVKLLAVGTVVPIKNALTLAQGLACCRDAGADVQVAWAGRHPESSTEYRHAVDRTIDELGLGDRWRWLGESDNIADLLAQHDALIHPSVHEGLSNAVCEALAAGRPVLAGAVADHSRLVDNGVSGFLFEPSKPEQIGAAMAQFASQSAADRLNMDARAREVALERLTMDRCAREYDALFRRVLQYERRRGGRRPHGGRIYVLGRVPPPYGGVSVFVQRRIEQLKQIGAAPVHLDPGRRLHMAAGLLRCGLDRDSVIEVNSLRMSALLMLAMTGNLRSAIVYDHNHSRQFPTLSNTRQKIVGRLLSQVRTVRIVEEHLRSHYQGRWIRLPASVEVVSPFLPPLEHVETDVVSRYPAAILEFVDRRRPVILTSVWRFSSSRGDDVYGVRLCLALLSRLREAFPSIGLVIALGDAAPGGGGAELQGVIQKMDVADNVLVMTGAGELWPLMRRSDAFIRATSTDGASVSVLEALHVGCPVVATNVVPRPDGVRLFRHGDLDEMVQATLDALTSGAMRS